MECSSKVYKILRASKSFLINRFLTKNVYCVSIIFSFISVSGGKRPCDVSLPAVLRFATGCEEEPLLGYGIEPTLKFIPAVENDRFLPTSNTCINQIQLYTETLTIFLPKEDKLFDYFDTAFVNEHFGLI